MHLSRILRQARILRNLCHVRNYKAASQMANYGLNWDAVVYDRTSDSYYVPDLNISINTVRHGLLAVLWQARELKRAGVKFSNVVDEIVAHTPEFDAAVENQDELFILMEIIARGAYGLLPDSDRAVVLDIGMHVGFASLHFAAQPFVKEVWSYEPVPATYARAERNLRRNPDLALKIKPFNYGLSDKTGDMVLHYCAQWKGAAGLLGLSPEFRQYHGVRPEEIETVKVQTRSAGEVVREMRLAHPGARLIVKLDAEGAEYAILAALEREGLLQKVDHFLIEWHQQGPQELERMLTKAGFSLFSFKNSTTGVIYACNGHKLDGVPEYA